MSRLEEDFKGAMVALTRTGHRIKLDLSPEQAMAVVGQVQLALRHPENRGASTQVAARVVDYVRNCFDGSPAIQAVIDKGWEGVPGRSG